MSDLPKPCHQSFNAAKKTLANSLSERTGIEKSDI